MPCLCGMFACTHWILVQNYAFLTYGKHQYLREKPYFLYNYQFLKQSSQISKKRNNLKIIVAENLQSESLAGSEKPKYFLVFLSLNRTFERYSKVLSFGKAKIIFGFSLT